MTVKLVPVSSLQKGRYIVIEGVACKITDMQTSRPGKHGHSKIRIQAIGLTDDRKRDIVMPGHDNVEAPVIEKKNAQILSISGDTANVMDMESYETFDIKIPEELKGQLSEGMQVLYWIVLNERILKQTKGE